MEFKKKKGERKIVISYWAEDEEEDEDAESYDVDLVGFIADMVLGDARF